MVRHVSHAGTCTIKNTFTQTLGGYHKMNATKATYLHMCMPIASFHIFSKKIGTNKVNFVHTCQNSKITKSRNCYQKALLLNY